MAVHDDITPSVLIYQGLEIEDLQYVLSSVLSIKLSHTVLGGSWLLTQPH